MTGLMIFIFNMQTNERNCLKEINTVFLINTVIIMSFTNTHYIHPFDVCVCVCVCMGGWQKVSGLGQ